MATALTSATETRVERTLRSSLQVHQSIAADTPLVQGIAEAASWIAEAFQRGHRLLLAGNGGSAADAQHLAAEFVGRYLFERRPLPALALTTNTSTLTAIGNDYGYDQIFLRQVEAYAEPGDVLLCISTSGNSRNVSQAALLARARGLTTIALTGEDGGELRECVHLCLRAPSRETPRIQEAHILIAHAIAELVEAGSLNDPIARNSRA